MLFLFVYVLYKKYVRLIEWRERYFQKPADIFFFKHFIFKHSLNILYHYVMFFEFFYDVRMQCMHFLVEKRRLNNVGATEEILNSFSSVPVPFTNFIFPQY